MLITVPTMVRPVSRPWSRIYSPHTAMVLSPSMTCPRSSIIRQRSASPSKAMPRSYSPAVTIAARLLQMGGAAAVIDVHTVGLAVDKVRLHLELGEQVRGRNRYTYRRSR